MGYALNDVILIILWTMAAMEEIAYISVVVCFIAFFVNDIYGFINWHRMGQRQGSEVLIPFFFGLPIFFYFVKSIII